MEMNNENRGAYYLAKKPNLFEPARGNTFRFYVYGLNKLLRASYAGTEPDAYLAEDAEDMFELSVKSTAMPKFSQEPITIRRGNSIVKAAGLPTFNEGSVTIDDFIGADGRSILMAWQNLSYNVSTQMIGYMSDYKKDAILIEYDPNYKKVREWTMYGCWISDITPGEFDHDNGDKRAITATIQYDWAEMKLPD